ncbi:MAG: uroporphyrinogen-III C-methyltransferase [Acidimicrobiales bacterium mtb01]|nr:uroporphyrinogen-III C-methyltransferase [Actinomycetota bacterium]TEX47841.1 MAG: uroporphyrinogen-III C-methyltransferase [Acidimicrobiales bacterium mtb01]
MTVHLVGAGPGDPGLLTVRAAELIGSADVVVHDALVDPSILELARPDAEFFDVGKWPGGGTSQSEIMQLLIELGRTSRSIVRLKGGDPFVFGRGGEEAQALVEAGIEFSVVPGISSAIAAPAAAGIPVTQRGVSLGFVVVSGHTDGTPGRRVEWEALARSGLTIVILMGVAERGVIADQLIDGGLGPRTPVAVVRHGTRADQHVVRTVLEELALIDVSSPAVIVVGAVADLDVFSDLYSASVGRS